jgi:hypothetical protein
VFTNSTAGTATAVLERHYLTIWDYVRLPVIVTECM